MLYEDSLWDYEGSDRYEKLSDRSEELIQEYKTELQERRDIFYIESKSLTELQIPGKFLYIFEGCTGVQTLNAKDVAVVSDKEIVLLTKFVGEEREIQPGACNKLEVQIYADDPSSIKVVISSLDIEIPAIIYKSLRDQIHSEIVLTEVVCKEGLVLLLKTNDGSPCMCKRIQRIQTN